MMEYVKALLIIAFYLFIGFLIIVGIPIAVWSFIETFLLNK